MNTRALRQLIKGYKKHFQDIHNEEIYKWQAVKHFQKKWDIEAPDFSEMLSELLRLTNNLLDSGQYFSKNVANLRGQGTGKCSTAVH